MDFWGMGFTSSGYSKGSVGKLQATGPTEPPTPECLVAHLSPHSMMGLAEPPHLIHCMNPRK